MGTRSAEARERTKAHEPPPEPAAATDASCASYGDSDEDDAEDSDDEFDELKSKPKMKIFMQPGRDLNLEFQAEDEMECEVEVVTDPKLTQALCGVSVFDVPPPTYPLSLS